MPSVLGWALRPKDSRRGWCDSSGFLCPRYRAGLCDVAVLPGRLLRCRVSMPSISGWALRRSDGDYISSLKFLCPRYRAGLCDVRLYNKMVGALKKVSMPSISGWALRRHALAQPGHAHAAVSMPSISGWALRPRDRPGTRSADYLRVSMPSISGWALRLHPPQRDQWRQRCCFYALDIGLGFATVKAGQDIPRGYPLYALDT